ncbi:hypothetical protein [Bacteroides stercorirosoris]|uniref:hypothetical protein n=1 Tax=Bacteroides stercorirosoris TaxID=871324 RepID=UPI0011C14149|nr:hypothetical protein [Bacteroides stercorirosoris]
MKKSITFLLYGLFVLLAACSDDSDTSPAPTLTTGSVVNLYSSEAIIEGSINIPEFKRKRIWNTVFYRKFHG